jgi:predicted ester cyclase
MSLTNKNTVRRLYDEVLNLGQLNVMDELCSPDFIDHTPAQGTSAGLGDVKQQIAAWRRAFPDLRVTVDEIFAEADSLAVRITWESTHQGEFMGVSPTGQRIVSSGVDILHVRHDRVTEAWHYRDDGALRQLGSPR